MAAPFLTQRRAVRRAGGGGVAGVGDGEASADIINLSKFLPDRMWPDEDGVLRDRSDMGKETVEQGPPGATRHP